MAFLPRKTNLRILLTRPTLFMRIYWLSLAGLALGTVADLITTYQNEMVYGTSIEMHFVQRWFSELFGIAAGVTLAKVGQFACAVFVAAWWRPWCRVILLLCGFLYGLAACSNHFLWL